MRARSRLLVVGVVTGALVLTGCADDDVDLLDDGIAVGVRDGDEIDLEDADLLEDEDLDDIERGVILIDEVEGIDDVTYAAEVVDQCVAGGGEERPDAATQLRVDLTGEGSMLVTYDADADTLLDVDLVTEPDAPEITWDAAGAGEWIVRDDALVAEVTVDGPDADGEPDQLMRFVVDWVTDTPECLDLSEPITELSGQASWLEFPGARLDAVEVCETPTEDGRTWTMVLEDGSILEVIAEGDDVVRAELTLTTGEAGSVDLLEYANVEADDGDIEGLVGFTDPQTAEPVTAEFRIDREAALACEG